jgi:hypothetical protein
MPRSRTLRETGRERENECDGHRFWKKGVIPMAIVIHSLSLFHKRALAFRRSTPRGKEDKME